MKPQILFVVERRDWIPPDGLDRCRPREVRLTAAGKGVAAIALLLLAGSLAAGIGLGMVASRQAGESRLLREESVVAEAVVTRLWRRGDKNRERWMSYRFIAGEQIYGGSRKIPAAIWGELHTGAHIPVRYIPSKPDINSPLNLSITPLPSWVPFAVSFALAAVGLLIVLVIRGQSRLLSEGRAAPGLVTKHSKAQKGSYGSDLGQKVYYAFPLLSGTVVQGQAGPIKNPPAIGSTIPVLYDPDKPRRNAPYPLSLVTPANRRPLR